jgi:uncharacterized membrane protein YdjX (TVP38/TMEM64 family)
LEFNRGVETGLQGRPPPPPRPRWLWLRLGLLAALLVGGVVAFRFTPLREYQDPARAREAADAVRAAPWAPAAAVAAYVALTVVCFPSSIVSILLGAAFGFAWGLPIVVIGSNLGAWAAFALGRALGRDFVESKLGAETSKLRRFDVSIRERGLLRVLQARLFVLLPFILLNYAFGLTPVRFRDYALGSFLGMLPSNVALVLMSSSLAEAWLEQGAIPFPWIPVAISTALLAGVSVLPLLFRRELPRAS